MRVGSSLMSSGGALVGWHIGTVLGNATPPAGILLGGIVLLTIGVGVTIVTAMLQD